MLRKGRAGHLLFFREVLLTVSPLQPAASLGSLWDRLTLRFNPRPSTSETLEVKQSYTVPQFSQWLRKHYGSSTFIFCGCTLPENVHCSRDDASKWTSNQEEKSKTYLWKMCEIKKKNEQYTQTRKPFFLFCCR